MTYLIAGQDSGAGESDSTASKDEAEDCLGRFCMQNCLSVIPFLMVVRAWGEVIVIEGRVEFMPGSDKSCSFVKVGFCSAPGHFLYLPVAVKGFDFGGLCSALFATCPTTMCTIMRLSFHFSVRTYFRHGTGSNELARDSM